MRVIGALRRWAGHPAAERGVLAWLFVLLPAADLLLRTAGLRRSLRWLEAMPARAGDRRDPRHRDDDIAWARRVAELARLAGHRHPWPASCLRQSLAVSFLLRRQGLTPRVVIGVHRPLSEGPAHAWVEVEGVALDPEADRQSAFVGGLIDIDRASVAANGADAVHSPTPAAAASWLLLVALVLAALVGMPSWAVRAGVGEPLLGPWPASDAAPVDTAGEALQCPAPWQRPREESITFAEADIRSGYTATASVVLTGAVWIVLLGAAVASGPRPPRTWPGITLLCLIVAVALSAALALDRAGGLAALAGALAAAPWLFATLGQRLALDRVTRLFARGCIALLAFQLLLAPIEVLSDRSPYLTHKLGLPLHRLAGTFDVPTALGAFAVCTWAMALAWGGLSRRAMAGTTLLTGLVLMLASSGAAWLAFVLTASLVLHRHLPPRWRVATLVAAAPLAIVMWLALPALTGRPDIHDSAWGRLLPITEFVELHLQPADLLIGSRFGVGTHAYEALHLATAHEVAAPGTRPPVDSTPAVLLWQAGLPGLLAAYAAILLCLLRDQASRPVGVALATSSMVFSIAEALPLGIALGLWLARAQRPSPVDPG